jgi:DNA-binding winged helix-turn-helix (wHTH) protein/TolB-like protein
LNNKHQEVEIDKVFRLGPWIVEPASGTLRRNDEVVHLAPKVMDLLLILVRNQGEVVTKEQLMSSVWPDTFVAETALTRSVSELRHSLADSSGSPVFIETIPKRGYRLLIEAEEIIDSKSTKPWIIPVSIGISVFLFCVAIFLFFGYLLNDRNSNHGEVHSLVILPFDNTGMKPESAVMTLGVVEIISESLSRIDSLDVASGTSLTHFENSTRDLKDLARRMGFRNLLEGSFKQTGEGISVLVRLSDTESREVLWSEEFPLNKENTGEVAASITLSVAGALNVMDHMEAEGDSRDITADYEALQYRLMADHFRNKIPDALEQAVEYYQKSIQEKPSYAPAYAGLAIAYMGLGAWGEDTSWAPKAQEAVSRALALDETIPESHIANGVFLRVYRKDFLASERALKEAIRIDPYHSNARREYGLLLMRELGRPDEALFQLSEASRLDPLMERNYIHLFELYCIKGDYEMAMSTAQRQHGLNPVNPLAHRNIAEAYFLLGDNDEAIEWAVRSVDLYDYSRKGWLYARVFQLLTLLHLIDGSLEKAEQVSRRLDDLAPDSSESLASLGIVALYNREYNLASGYFKRALELKPDGSVWPTGIRASTYLAYTLKQMGDSQGFRQALSQSDQLRSESNASEYEKNIWPPFTFQDELAGYVLRGEIDEAIKYLDGLVETGWKACVLVETNPLFEEALQNPEFRRLCDSVKPGLESMRLRIETENLSLR